MHVKRPKSRTTAQGCNNNSMPTNHHQPPSGAATSVVKPDTTNTRSKVKSEEKLAGVVTHMEQYRSALRQMWP